MDCVKRDETCYCPHCDEEMSDEDVSFQSALSDTAPPYVVTMKCPACAKECVCERGSPKPRLRPS